MGVSSSVVGGLAEVLGEFEEIKVETLERKKCADDRRGIVGRGAYATNRRLFHLYRPPCPRCDSIQCQIPPRGAFPPHECNHPNQSLCRALPPEAKPTLELRRGITGLILRCRSAFASLGIEFELYLSPASSNRHRQSSSPRRYDPRSLSPTESEHPRNALEVQHDCFLVQTVWLRGGGTYKPAVHCTAKGNRQPDYRSAKAIGING
jgi:hypothetical protein